MLTRLSRSSRSSGCNDLSGIESFSASLGTSVNGAHELDQKLDGKKWSEFGRKK
jgi:hypothetical protein